MNAWHYKICALVLALAMMPGSVEFIENAGHLLAEGHLAHAEAHEDHHEPAGPEHGCTPVFHACGCHASLAFMSSRAPAAISFHVVGSFGQQGPGAQAIGFGPSIDHPPQV